MPAEHGMFKKKLYATSINQLRINLKRYIMKLCPFKSAASCYGDAFL